MGISVPKWAGFTPPPLSESDKALSSKGFEGFPWPFPALQKNVKKMFESR
jgi:hypothetical protein